MSRIVFTHANLIDGDKPARRDTTVIVDGERIASVTSSEVMEPRADDRVVDLAGKTIMPGLVSCHFHSVFHQLTPGDAPQLGLKDPPAYVAMLAANNARIALESGVTSVVCSSTPYAIDASLKLAIEDGIMPGPRIKAGSHELMSTGDIASGGMRNYWLELGNQAVVRSVDGVAEMCKVVRDEIKQGAEGIKLSTSQGHNAGPTEDSLSFTPAEIASAVDTAHARGALVRAHAASRRSVLECAKAGVDIIDHADRMDAECVEAVLASGSTIVPSMFYIERSLAFLDSGAMDNVVSGAMRSMFQKTIDSMRDDTEYLKGFLPEVNKAGVKIVCGDDYGTIFLPHGDYAKELEFYVERVGIEPLDVIRWATRNGAELFGRGDELGTVEEGKLADLLVVDGDPLADIACLQDPAKFLAILKGGEFVKDCIE